MNEYCILWDHPLHFDIKITEASKTIEIVMQ